MTADREAARNRLLSAEQVAEAVGLANAAGARKWLSEHGIPGLSGYPADEVHDAIASRRGRGRWGPRSHNGGKAEEEKH